MTSKLCRKCGVTKTVDDFTACGRHCRDCTRLRYKAWSESNAVKAKEYRQEYYKQNAEALREKNRQRYNENSEANRLYRQNNAEKRAAQLAEWKRSNAGRVAEMNARRYAAKKRRTMRLTEQQHLEMTSIYEQASSMTKQTGVQYHVDHIVPMQGKTVCGLHVPWNLRIITANENMSKGAAIIAELAAPAFVGVN
jgi:hypothetical protein